MSLCWSFGLHVLCDPSLSPQNRICLGSLLSSNLLKWPTHLRLRWANILYMPGGLHFSGMNLFGICSHHLTFSILHKWRIIQTWSLWASALYTVQVSVLYRRVEKTMVQYTVHLVFISLNNLWKFLRWFCNNVFCFMLKCYNHN